MVPPLAPPSPELPPLPPPSPPSPSQRPPQLPDKLNPPSPVSPTRSQTLSPPPVPAQSSVPIQQLQAATLPPGAAPPLSSLSASAIASSQSTGTPSALWERRSRSSSRPAGSTTSSASNVAPIQVHVGSSSPSSSSRGAGVGIALVDGPVTSAAPGAQGLGQQITATELRAEMETLMSLRRRSLSQPTTLDPDLPPTTPSSPTSASRPQLSISVTPPSQQITPTGQPVSPTAPAAAETGTLIRRKSSNTGRLPSDHPLPELPPPSPPPPLVAAFSSSPAAASAVAAVADGAVASTHTAQELFWLPASLHPELAPQEFKAFIREQTRPDNLARRVSGGGRVDRKKSMLRGEYKPRTDDGVGEMKKKVSGTEQVQGDDAGSQKRTDAPATRLNFEELTISDLQKLEQLAARAEAEAAAEGEGEGERLGRVLRRSLSLNPSHLAQAAAEGAHRTVLDMNAQAQPDGDHSDAPIIVPPPGQILRRSARTKIRKAGLVGDGGGHRFGPSRRVRQSTSDALSMDDHDGGVDSAFDTDDRRSISPTGSTESSDMFGTAAEVDARKPKSPPSPEVEVEYLEVAPVVDVISSSSSSDITGSWLRGESVTPPESSTSLSPAPSSSKQPSPPPPTPPSKSDPVFASPSSKPVASAIPLVPSQPSGPSPSSADYDWATHHKPPQAQQQPVPPQQQTPVVSLQYPKQQAPSPVVPPPPQVRPASPAASPPTSRPSSIRDGKEKKSGWARLGLGVKSSTSEDDDGKKKKGKGKEKEKEADRMADVVRVAVEREKEKEREREREREREKEKEPGFFGGLFGKKKIEQEVNIYQAPPTTPPPEIRTPPPPPTASGALLPNGRYTNFYRLPIHVERAVYRLSHIKLANPRRPLYEQVLISNLMFWYLSVINKPVAPPPVPAAAPIPVPVEAVEPKRSGLNKPARGPGRSSPEMPIKQPQYEQQNRQIEMEQQSHPQQQQPPPQQQHHHHHQQQQQPQQNPAPVRPPLVPRSGSNGIRVDAPPPPQHPASPERSGGWGGESWPTPEQRDSSHPSDRPIAVASYPKPNSGFEVTSRTARDQQKQHRRRASSGTDEGQRSSTSHNSHYDESEIFDAYSSSPPPANQQLQTTLDWPKQADTSHHPSQLPAGQTIAPRRRGESLNAVTTGPYRTLSPTVELSPTLSSGEAGHSLDVGGGGGGRRAVSGGR
ncbi:hypothetical protein T439DRAFT_354725 [Meredithblackwellia eburnea MCA 4105]